MESGPGVWLDLGSEPGPDFGPQLGLGLSFQLALGDGPASVAVPEPELALEL